MRVVSQEIILAMLEIASIEAKLTMGFMRTNFHLNPSETAKMDLDLATNNYESSLHRIETVKAMGWESNKNTEAV